MKTIGICSDHAGYALKQYVKQWLETKGWEYKDFGTYSPESVDYPDFAHPLALAVEAGECYPGIAICGSGNGINMTLKNLLVMPGRFVTNQEADEIMTKFFSTPFEGGRHQRRVEKIPVTE